MNKEKKIKPNWNEFIWNGFIAITIIYAINCYYIISHYQDWLIVYVIVSSGLMGMSYWSLLK